MNLITFTDSAVSHILRLMSKNSNTIGFRLSIKKTGCSGYAYVPDLIEKINEDDIHFMVQNDLAVYVDRKNEAILKDLVVDYVKEGVGLKQERLVFINPQEKNRCGCGESFTIEP